MSTIYHLPHELLARIVAVASLEDSHALPWPEVHNPKQDTHKRNIIECLSMTNRALRALALPFLWRHASISLQFDDFTDSLRGIESFWQPTHPVRQYARSLALRIESQAVTLSRVLLASLDFRLGRAVNGMAGLQHASLQMRTGFQFPRTMRALLSRKDLKSLTIAARGNLSVPAIRAESLEKLLIHSDSNSCQVALSAFPSLKELSLSMEDNTSFQSWDDLRFPPQLWSTLESLSLRGFVLDPFVPLGRLQSSISHADAPNTLRTVSYHLARDEQDATYAWQIFSQLPLASLSITLPFLFDARYARRMVRAFPKLERFELFAFSRAAAWQWPDPFTAYINAFAELDNLKVLSLNHNDLTASSPNAMYPLYPSLPVTLAVNIDTATSQMSDLAISVPQEVQVEATETEISPDGQNSEEEEEEEEQVVYGPLGLNFCPNTSPGHLEKQAEMARSLFGSLPTLKTVNFEPGLSEQVRDNPFAYAISETTYQRESFQSL